MYKVNLRMVAHLKKQSQSRTCIKNRISASLGQIREETEIRHFQSEKLIFSTGNDVILV